MILGEVHLGGESYFRCLFLDFSLVGYLHYVLTQKGKIPIPCLISGHWDSRALHFCRMDASWLNIVKMDNPY